LRQAAISKRRAVNFSPVVADGNGADCITACKQTLQACADVIGGRFNRHVVDHAMYLKQHPPRFRIRRVDPLRD